MKRMRKTPGQLSLPRGNMSVELAVSLQRLKRAIDAVPVAEREQKERRWQELQGHLSIR